MTPALRPGNQPLMITETGMKPLRIVAETWMKARTRYWATEVMKAMAAKLRMSTVTEMRMTLRAPKRSMRKPATREAATEPAPRTSMTMIITDRVV